MPTQTLPFLNLTGCIRAQSCRSVLSFSFYVFARASLKFDLRILVSQKNRVSTPSPDITPSPQTNGGDDQRIDVAHHLQTAPSILVG